MMKGWYSRGYLPHFDGGEILQFITLHLADAVPKAIVEKWKIELASEKEEIAQKILFWRIEKFADQGCGACYLQRPEIADVIRNSLLYFHNEKYNLIAWVIMPNHIHFLMRPAEDQILEKIMHSIKSFTAQKANKLLNRKGQFWQEDYFDRYIRNYEHYEKTVNYIEFNPVKAKLCEKQSDWFFSSAFIKQSEP